MFFSLLVGTLNRCAELEKCLNSLVGQTYKDFEVIVIDQSDNDKTECLIGAEKYKPLKIKYDHVNFKGLSNARNYALEKAEGEFFALIDDDAFYESHYFEKAHDILSRKGNLILSGYMTKSDGSPALHEYTRKRCNTLFTVREIIRMAPSPGLIFPMSIYNKGMKFDSDFGVGAEFGACEETDLILTALDSGYNVLYVKDMVLIHPTGEHSYEIENDTELKKKRNYAKGLGALFTKDYMLRKSNRLKGVLLEKKLKIIIKSTGILGSKRKQFAVEEGKGLRNGMSEYELLMKEKCV